MRWLAVGLSFPISKWGPQAPRPPDGQAGGPASSSHNRNAQSLPETRVAVARAGGAPGPEHRAGRLCSPPATKALTSEGCPLQHGPYQAPPQRTSISLLGAPAAKMPLHREERLHRGPEQRAGSCQAVLGADAPPATPQGPAAGPRGGRPTWRAPRALLPLPRGRGEGGAVLTLTKAEADTATGTSAPSAHLPVPDVAGRRGSGAPVMPTGAQRAKPDLPESSRPRGRAGSQLRSSAHMRVPQSPPVPRAQVACRPIPTLPGPASSSICHGQTGRGSP